MFITIFSILLLLSYVLAKAITATAKVITTLFYILAFIFVQPSKNILYKCIYETKNKNKKMVGQV
jgi:hypothetical protein